MNSITGQAQCDPFERTMRVEADTAGDNTTYLQHLIQKRAYELYEARGCKPGHEIEDWLSAEKEIKHHLNF